MWQVVCIRGVNDEENQEPVWNNACNFSRVMSSMHFVFGLVTPFSKYSIRFDFSHVDLDPTEYHQKPKPGIAGP